MIGLSTKRKTKFDMLDVGDKVLVQSGSYGGHDRIMTIARLTKTQFVIGGSKFNRKTGRQVGNTAWRSSWIRWADEDTIARVSKEHRHRVLVQLMTITKWKDFTLEQLEAVNLGVKGALNAG